MEEEYTQQDMWDLIDEIIEFVERTDSEITDYLQELKNKY